MADELGGDLDAFQFWDEHECVRAQDLLTYTRKVQAKEREQIAAFIDTGGALWGRSDLEESDEAILNNLPARIRNGEHETGPPVK